MKKLTTKIAMLFALILSLTGCATKNPSYNPGAPPTISGGSNPEYIPGTNAIAGVIGTVKEINSAAPTPYQGLINNGLDLALGLSTLIAGLVATSKNKTASVAKKAGQVMANVIAGGGGALVALANAPDQETAGAIAVHLQNAPLQTAAPPPKTG